MAAYRLRVGASGPPIVNARVTIWGQSNAVGRAARSDISASPLTADPELATYDAGTFSRVYIWNGSAYINLQPSVFNGQTVTAGQFGPEFGLAVRWTRETTEGNLYIDKNADGGLSITEFDPTTGSWYSSGVTEGNQGTAWLLANDVSIQSTSLLWIQGEQDAAQTQSWYQTKLADMISAMRSASIISAESLAVLSQMNPSTSTYGAGVFDAKAAYAAANPGTATTVLMPYYSDDTIHLNARGQVQHSYDVYKAIFGGAQINV